MLTEKGSCPRHIDWCQGMKMRGARRKWSCAWDVGGQVNGREKGLYNIESYVKYGVNWGLRVKEEYMSLNSMVGGGGSYS